MEKTAGQKAYEDWKKQQKVSMQVHTDEQMFILGYDIAAEYTKEVAEIALSIEKENGQLNDQIIKLKKQLKAATK